MLDKDQAGTPPRPPNMRIQLDHYQPDTLFEDTWLSEDDRLRYLEVEEKKKRGRDNYYRTKTGKQKK